MVQLDLADSRRHGTLIMADVQRDFLSSIAATIAASKS
jgi:hypothetical protein